MKVSCQCITYNRPELLEESIESFLRQDYKGKKELVILNDTPQQILKFNHPEVIIINIPRRFGTIGEKRNACVSLCSGDIIFPWDDDDISLPWRISLSLQYKDKNRYFKNKRAWIWSGGILKPEPGYNSYHAMGCWDRSLFVQVGGYPIMQSGQDTALENKYKETGERNVTKLPLEELFYIYRFGGTGSPHLSSYGRNNGWAEIGKRKIERVGLISLSPHWRQDYVGMTKKAINNIKDKDKN
ncbi:MAG: glycosyltransferase family 2 protein [Candidatus Aminicenantes bacterium]|nr:MAG: glycosyltransferase family 2 protein [Candidatus Aminicenantes bacterium]